MATPISCTGSISFSPFRFGGLVNTGQSGSISVDPSTPAVVVATGSSSKTITTASFSPPGHTLLAVLTSYEYQASNANAPAFTVTDSASGTYAAGPAAFDGARGATAIWTRYLYTAPGSMTVTVTDNGVSATHGQILAVYVLQGANSVQAKAATGMAYSGTGTTGWTGNISTTVPGSWVLLAGAGSAEGTIAANSSTLTLENEQDATDAVSLFTGRQIVPTGQVSPSSGGGGTGVTLTVTTTSLPSGTDGTAYSATLAAKGGTGTGYTWTISAGSLPAGLSLAAATGVISGTPTGTGTSSFTVKITDSGSNTASQGLSITVAAAPPTSTNPSWDPTGSWTSVFDDEFTGTSLNTTYWGAGWQAKTGISGPINSSEAVTYSSANVSVSNSYLNLALIGTSGAGQGACVTTNTNGTGGSAGFASGPPVAFEAYINVQGATSGSDVGIYNWPAFWNDGQVWPTDGEIDVLEGLGGFAAYHIHDSAGGPGANVGSLGDYVGWHTFGCYWQSSGVIDFYYDGVLVGSETGNFSEPHYIIVNYTTTPGAGDPTGVMNVDWVRAWTPG